MSKIIFRVATYADLDLIYNELETKCFPKDEQIDYEYYKDALKLYSDHFFLLYSNDILVGLINALPTNETELKDIMYFDNSLYDAEGINLCIIGLMILPKYKSQGYGKLLMNHLISVAKEEKRSGIILTCRKHLVSYYEQFGFKYEGLSSSTMGGLTWHKMTLYLK
jgi:Acetyltransferases